MKRRADYQGMRNNLILTNWTDNFLTSECSNSVKDMWLSFKSKIYELRNRFVPKTTVTGKPSWNKKGRIPAGGNTPKTCPSSPLDVCKKENE